MATIKFLKKITGIGNSASGLILPSDGAEMAGLDRGKYYIFEVKAREVKDLKELEEWQTRKFEVTDEKGRKLQKASRTDRALRGYPSLVKSAPVDFVAVGVLT